MFYIPIIVHIIFINSTVPFKIFIEGIPRENGILIKAYYITILIKKRYENTLINFSK
ncbi:hypothetical protein FFONT_1106 [Fervidicoccus fontis Kam940]|uniref:Uncharacterized protein n=1 Tax=Fervidicoccus fontis (strain DSM 19380 / JCM 18336 / VKM B-2539 / Kam940) TaxID=1163730 RepID=I0A287_FERFK|nr:hypothetical protein FFONT_1106 [Fervidicoccus fontis Kam940]